MLFVLQAMLRM